jgi:ATP-dependent Clp protease adaptor protein ClpS
VFAAPVFRPAQAQPGLAAIETAEPRTTPVTRLAPRYKVLLHNDDHTPMVFVLDLLRSVFKKDHPEAFRIMMEAHTGGVALVEIVALEQAELHIDQCHSLARTRKHPLTLTCEPA